MSIQRDVDAELRFHFEARIEELVEQGVPRETARARALQEFGDVDDVRSRLAAIDRRAARRRGRIEWTHGVRQDVAYAVRSLRRTPAVAVAIVLTLALGLGANAAMFSLLDVIFLRPPAGVERPSQVRRLWMRAKFTTGVHFWSGFDYQAYDAVARSVAGGATATLFRSPARLPLGRDENAPSAGVSYAAASYFSLLGVRPQLGRFYAPDEDRLDAPSPVAVVSDAFWKRELGGASDAVGRTITLGKRHFLIVGVAPPGFTGTEVDATDVWLPLGLLASARAPQRRPWWEDSNVDGFQILLRLGSTGREAEVGSRATAALHMPGLGYEHDTVTVAALASIIKARGPGDLRAEMRVATRLGGVAVIVLLIACANVVNLLLARAVRRRREIAVRLALGVSRARLVRLLVTESVLLSLIAAAAALAAAAWGGALLRKLLMPDVHFAASPLEWRLFLFALTLALGAGALAGLIPALQSVSPDITNALKAGSREGGLQHSRLRHSLVVAQAALSVLLLVGAVLFVRSLRNVKGHDVGYSIDDLVFASLRFDARDSVRDAGLRARLFALRPRIAAIPGVERVAYTSMPPLGGVSFEKYFPDERHGTGKLPIGEYTAVTPDYFATTGTKLLRGRTFTADPASDAPYEVIVDRTQAEAIWPNENPIGHCLRFVADTMPCARVIGVAQPVILDAIDERPQAHFYVSMAHSPFPTFKESNIVVRAAPDRIPGVERAVHDLLRGDFPTAVVQQQTMGQVMEPQYRPWELGATLFTLFGALALVVAGVGIYSSVSYAVSQRAHEFGVRIALGAQTGDVLRQVLGEGARTVAVGIALGAVLALGAGRFVASLLYGIAPSDPAATVIVAAMLMSIALLAALAPAWRAATADPVGALRAD